MKKLFAITTVILTAAMLAACADKTASLPDSPDSSQTEVIPEIGENNGSPSSSVESGTESTEGSHTETTSETAETAEPAPDFKLNLVGLDGEPVTAEDITTAYFNNDGSYTSGISEKFVYLSENTGICLNSRDNADRFDSETLTFTDVPEFAPNVYKRYYIGDTIGGLTLVKANTSVYNNSEPIYYCAAEFEGSATLSGYLAIAPEDEYGVDEGDIFLVPFEDGCELPVLNYRYSDGQPVNRLHVRGENELYWINEYPRILVGNIHDTSADLSGIPADYSYSVKATVTVDNISMLGSLDFNNYVNCRLVSVELL